MVFEFENYITNPYLRAIIIVLLVFIILRIIVYLIEKVIFKLAKKTKSDRDDIFIKRSSKAVSFLVLLFGFLIAIRELPIGFEAIGIAEKLIFSVMVISVAYIIYVFLDVILLYYLGKVLKGEHSNVIESIMSLAHGVINIILVSLAFLYILNIWGIEIGPFLAGLGIAGIAIAFAMQSTLSNVFSGASIILDKSVQVGDLIYLDNETKGKVVKVGLRSTQILSFDNEMLIVPNSKIADSKIQNVAKPDPKARVIIPFSVAYGTDVEKVKKVVLKEIKKIKHFVDNPEPMVRFLEMADSGLIFKAYFHVESFMNRFAAIDEANTRIYNALNSSGINIPFPQMDVHLKKK
jgi:MscS family membrane protein